MRAALALALAVVAGACDRRAPIAACTDDLRGAYTAGDQHWMILDNRATLEAYPLFPDAPTAAGFEVAPRVIDLSRKAGELAGTVHRRYLRGTARCEATAPIHVTACAGDALELVLADPQPPLTVEPCTWPRPAPSRVERWVRD